MPRRKNNPGTWQNEAVMERAERLFGRKRRKSGAGDYTAGELIRVYDSLRKDPPKGEL